jgi:hypothetical protein
MLRKPTGCRISKTERWELITSRVTRIHTLATNQLLEVTPIDPTTL